MGSSIVFPGISLRKRGNRFHLGSENDKSVEEREERNRPNKARSPVQEIFTGPKKKYPPVKGKNH